MKIVIMGSNGDSTYIVYDHLVRAYGDVSLILETPVSSVQLMKRRIKKLGVKKAAGQILFKLLVEPCLKIESRKRKKEILAPYVEFFQKGSREKIPAYHVESVNSDECRRLLSELQPDIVVVNGTKIIGKETIRAAECPMINLHTGITPKYRGVHGGYWALAGGDAENCGVTVHRIDEGIDTGAILRQERIFCTDKDNFCTYPYLQTIAGAKLEVEVIKDYMAGTLYEQVNNLPSMLWSHPTMSEYLKNRKKGIR